MLNPSAQTPLHRNKKMNLNEKAEEMRGIMGMRSKKGRRISPPPVIYPRSSSCAHFSVGEDVKEEENS